MASILLRVQAKCVDCPLSLFYSFTSTSFLYLSSVPAAPISLFFQHTSNISASGPLHLLFSVPALLHVCVTPCSFASGVCSDLTFTVRPRCVFYLKCQPQLPTVLVRPLTVCGFSSIALIIFQQLGNYTLIKRAVHYFLPPGIMTVPPGPGVLVRFCTEQFQCLDRGQAPQTIRE